MAQRIKLFNQYLNGQTLLAVSLCLGCCLNTYAKQPEITTAEAIQALPTTVATPQATPTEVITTAQAAISVNQPPKNYNLTLLDVLQITEEANPEIQSQKAATELAKAKYLTSLAKMLPDVTLGYLDTNFNGTMNIFGQLRNLDYQFRQPQFVFKFPVFQGGRKFLQAKSTKKLVRAQKQIEQGSKQVTLSQAANTYYELMKALQGVGLAEQTLKEAQEQLEINDKRLEVGIGTQLDVLQSKAQFAHAKQQLTEALNLSQIAATRLNEILDLPALALTRPTQDAAQRVELINTNLTAESLIQTAFNSRPELKALNEQIASLQSQRSMALTVILPDIDLQLRSGAIGPRLDDLSGFDETNIGLNLNLPNLGASALTLYKEKTAEIKQLKAQKAKLENEIEQQVSEAYLTAQSQQARYEAATAEAEAANEALVFATERLKAGVGRNIDVLDAQTKLSQARTNLNNVIAQSNQAQVNLVTAIGQASIKTLTEGYTVATSSSK